MRLGLAVRGARGGRAGLQLGKQVPGLLGCSGGPGGGAPREEPSNTGVRMDGRRHPLWVWAAEPSCKVKGAVVLWTLVTVETGDLLWFFKLNQAVASVSSPCM